MPMRACVCVCDKRAQHVRAVLDLKNINYYLHTLKSVP